MSRYEVSNLEALRSAVEVLWKCGCSNWKYADDILDLRSLSTPQLDALVNISMDPRILSTAGYRLDDIYIVKKDGWIRICVLYGNDIFLEDSLVEKFKAELFERMML